MTGARTTRSSCIRSTPSARKATPRTGTPISTTRRPAGAGAISRPGKWPATTWRPAARTSPGKDPNSNGELVDRFDNFYKTHVLGRPTNCSAALVALVLGGVFEKFPELKVVFFECSAEWILYWMHRMDDDWEWAKDFPQISGMLKMAPPEYIRRNCWVTCEADEADLERPIRELGEDRILMASD